ncbi:MAG: hypothetical protein P8Y69_12665 [Gammaproteobacteria bacterium]
MALPRRTRPASRSSLSERGYARRWTFYIDAEGIIRKIDREVDPRTAGEALVANLEALNVPRAN